MRHWLLHTASWLRLSHASACEQWFEVCKLPPLAFDHKLIVRDSFTQLAKQPEVQQSGDMTRLR